MSIRPPGNVFTLVKRPTTLLELFRLRTGGHLPDSFSTTIQGSVDVADMYGADALLNSSFVGAAGAFPLASGPTAFGSSVRIHAVSGFLQLGAAGGANNWYLGTLELRDLAGVQVVLFTQFYQAPAAGFANATNLQMGGQLPYPRVVPAGFQLRYTWQSNDPSVLHTPVLAFEFENLII